MAITENIIKYTPVTADITNLCQLTEGSNLYGRDDPSKTHPDNSLTVTEKHQIQ